MSPVIPSTELVRSPSRLVVRLGVTALWAFVAVAIIVMTTTGQAMKTGQLDPLGRFIWDIGWLGWAPLTFLILALCRRYPMERQHPWRSVIRFALIGLGVVMLQMTLDWLCITSLGKLLRDEPASLRTFVFVAIYKAHLYYGVYWMIVGAAHALEYHRRLRESELVSSRLETRLADAQLDRLKAQLQPHFLFNTHNTIVSLMAKRENEAAIRMLTRLSELLRVAMTRSGDQLVTVREEVEVLRLYLEIQRERFRDRLTIQVTVPDELSNAEVPHLLLQPLVENAFRHGLEEVAEEARLAVEITREGPLLSCTVRDNGPGFEASQNGATEGPGRRGGIGLSNTRERLRQLYGADHSLSIDCPPGGGCAVRVRLPYRVRTAAAVGAKPAP